MFAPKTNKIVNLPSNSIGKLNRIEYILTGIKYIPLRHSFANTYSIIVNH